jgi:hypothetical protein
MIGYQLTTEAQNDLEAIAGYIAVVGSSSARSECCPSFAMRFASSRTCREWGTLAIVHGARDLEAFSGGGWRD